MQSIKSDFCVQLLSDGIVRFDVKDKATINWFDVNFILIDIYLEKFFRRNHILNVQKSSKFRINQV